MATLREFKFVVKIYTNIDNREKAENQAIKQLENAGFKNFRLVKNSDRLIEE